MLSHKTDKFDFTVLASWKAEELKDYVKITAPENDISIYFLDLACPQAQNLGELATAAWKQIHPDFNLELSLESSIPATDNWDQIVQLIYNTPTSELRTVMAIVRTFNNRAYLCLLEGTTVGLSRRGAEFNIMYESWKPGIKIGATLSLLKNGSLKLEANLRKTTRKTWCSWIPPLIVL